MALTPGSRIGAYEVTSQLGEGGMGVVLRARDTKLLRDVALKVLPDHFADDPDRLSRLQREAQLLASINHPNIAQIYGLEQLGNVGCIVMELVEGETLGERLQQGPIPLSEALDIARQIADALSAAHERGIVHRDLKPANIKLTPNGTVKVLDFGLAKALANRVADTQFSMMPTKVSGSVAGMVVGTVGYMSPEQARGREVDARTDIWAFGCVLYEMLTARQAFEGETATDMIARIVSGQPDLSLLPPDTPRSVRLLLDATLNKNINQRLQHIGDMRLFLDDKFFPAAGSIAPASVVHDRKAKAVPLLIAAFAAGLLAALIPAFFYFRTPAPPSAPAMHFEMELPGLANSLAISPDGRRVAYLAQPADDNRAIWIRSIDGQPAVKLAGTDNPQLWFSWSPDSRYIAFASDGKLRKADVLGGPVTVICDYNGPPRGHAWNRDGVMLLTKDNGIYRVPDTGGEVAPVLTPDANRKETMIAGPVFLPDGNRFVYIVVSSVPENAGFFVASLDSKTPTRLMPLPGRVDNVAYAPPGYLLLSNGPALTAQRFNTSSLTLEGQPIPIADGLVNGNFSVSDNGVLLYRKGSNAAPPKRLVWYDRSGKQVGEISSSGNYGTIELSPSGDRVAVDMIASNNRDIWVIDIARGVPSRLTSDAASDWTPSWSPDGSRIIYASSRSGNNDIYQKASSGVGNEEAIFQSDQIEIPVHWARDGTYIVFSRTKPRGGNDTWLLEMSAEKKAVPFVESPFDKVHARVSPDGRWMAYASNDSGMYQVVVQSFPDPNGGKWQITAQGGVEPKWRRDGRELYYLGLDGKLMAVPLKADRTFEAGAPVALFESPLTVGRPQVSRDRRYDVSTDGRFLFATPADTVAGPAVIAVVNWTSGLPR
jgi:Tol biopolymer transport system component/tRNA A-37 threonylcarbamoyl transferase component Bud32